MSGEQEQVARTLWNDWDPIGVRSMGGPSDEYDSYVAEVLALLKGGVDEATLTSHLQAIQVDRMGLGQSDDASRAARALLALGIR